jgi:hypothetical protein
MAFDERLAAQVRSLDRFRCPEGRARPRRMLLHAARRLGAGKHPATAPRPAGSCTGRTGIFLSRWMAGPGRSISARTSRKFLYAMIRQMQPMRKRFFESLQSYAIGLAVIDWLDVDS